MNTYSYVIAYNKIKGEIIMCNCGTIIHEDKVENLKLDMVSEEMMIDLAEFFKIFGDSTRLKIIHVLMKEKMCVCDIAAVLNMSHSSISHQLKYLKNFKIVKVEKVGKCVYYALNDEHINKIFEIGKEHLNE